MLSTRIYWFKEISGIARRGVVAAIIVGRLGVRV